MTIAFVLSGGGSLGAVQVGMLQALAARGVEPDLVVGTSAGAMNAAWSKLGGATGDLGAPTADQSENGDVVTQKFSGGAISWKVGVPVSGRAALSAAQPDGVPPAATSLR